MMMRYFEFLPGCLLTRGQGILEIADNRLVGDQFNQIVNHLIVIKWGFWILKLILLGIGREKSISCP